MSSRHEIFFPRETEQNICAIRVVHLAIGLGQPQKIWKNGTTQGLTEFLRNNRSPVAIEMAGIHKVRMAIAPALSEVIKSQLPSFCIVLHPCPEVFFIARAGPIEINLGQGQIDEEDRNPLGLGKGQYSVQGLSLRTVEREATVIAVIGSGHSGIALEVF